MANGIVRAIDDLGRVVVPKEFRKSLGWESLDPIEISVSGNVVSLQKVESKCIICGSGVELTSVNRKLLCRSCKVDIAQSLGR